VLNIVAVFGSIPKLHRHQVLKSVLYPIHSGSTVYIEPMDGYETYITAAIIKKQVPLVVVTDKSKADYTITSNISQRAPTAPAVVINNTNGANNSSPHSGYPAPGSFGRTNASISVIDTHSSHVAFAYSVGKNANANQLQSTAEACAKHLKEFIEKSENPKK
jgi:hypothetical protein